VRAFLEKRPPDFRSLRKGPREPSS
jgi:hypothetical protein